MGFGKTGSNLCDKLHFYAFCGASGDLTFDDHHAHILKGKQSLKQLYTLKDPFCGFSGYDQASKNLASAYQHRRKKQYSLILRHCLPSRAE